MKPFLFFLFAFGSLSASIAQAEDQVICSTAFNNEVWSNAEPRPEDQCLFKCTIGGSFPYHTAEISCEVLRGPCSTLNPKWFDYDGGPRGIISFGSWHYEICHVSKRNSFWFARPVSNSGWTPKPHCSSVFKVLGLCSRH